MSNEQMKESSLVKVEAGEIARNGAPLTIGDLERALLMRFPAEDAETWDRTGLVVGDPSELITNIACALDPTRSAIDAAYAAGANVLVTHHPAFRDPPTVISPSRARTSAQGAIVWEAVDKHVALMSFHTTLDVSVAGSHMLPRILGLKFERVLVPSTADGKRGYGQLCSVDEPSRTITLAHLAARATSQFGKLARVWGDFDTELTRIATATGAARNVVEACLESQVDCLVCGELGYHNALDAHQAGLSIIELGHDTSEFPFTAILANEIREIGFDAERITVIDQTKNWETPEAVRV